MIRSIILCALFLGVANAARQINVDPSPPPPGPTTASVPGALVSLVAPGQSQATWSTAHSAALCASLVKNYTSLYNKDFIECSVKGVVDTTAHAAASVQTWMYWAQFAGMTDADKTSATQSRDLFINTLYSNPNAIDVLGKTVNVNDSCNAAWVSTTAQQSDVYSSIANLPLVQCRAAIRGSTAETYASGLCAGKAMDESLCFKSTTVLGDTTGAFGIDNGKQCPLGVGAISQATAPPQALMYASHWRCGRDSNQLGHRRHCGTDWRNDVWSPPLHCWFPLRWTVICDLRWYLDWRHRGRNWLRFRRGPGLPPVHAYLRVRVHGRVLCLCLDHDPVRQRQNWMHDRPYDCHKRVRQYRHWRCPSPGDNRPNLVSVLRHHRFLLPGVRRRPRWCRHPGRLPPLWRNHCWNQLALHLLGRRQQRRKGLPFGILRAGHRCRWTSNQRAECRLRRHILH